MSRALSHPRTLKAATGPGLGSENIGLGLRQRRQRQDPCPHAARAAAAAGRNAAGADPVPCLYQSGGGQHGRPRVQQTRAMDEPQRRRPREGDRRLRRGRAGSARPHLRAAIVRAHHRKPLAGSRFRRCTPSPRGCCGSFLSRPTSRLISRFSTNANRSGCSSRRATRRSRSSAPRARARARSTWSRENRARPGLMSSSWRRLAAPRSSAPTTTRQPTPPRFVLPSVLRRT